jgi:hypothetical protein
MSTASSGRAREWKVRDHMLAHGWQLVMRSAGSRGAADLAMVHPDRGLALLQIGTPNKTLGPADRARFVELATLCSALPIVAVVIPGIGVRYREANTLPASRWTEFQP